MGYERSAKPGAGAGLDEVMKIVLADGGLKDILDAFKNARPPRNPAESREASPDDEPPYAEEQPKTEDGAPDSQVADTCRPTGQRSHRLP